MDASKGREAHDENLPGAQAPPQVTEAHLRATIDGLSAHITVLDERGTIIFTNSAYREFARENGADLHAVGEGANYLTACLGAGEGAAGTTDGFARYVREVLDGTRDRYEVEYPCHAPHEQRWFIARVTPLQLGDRRHAIIAHSDITARKKAEQELRRSERLLRDIERVSHCGGWEYLVETGEMYWTPELYEIHEFPDHNVDQIEESLACYLPEDRERIRQAFARCIAEGVGYDLEVPFLTLNKRARWVRTRTEAIMESGRVVRVVGSVTDITERKQAEADLVLARKAVEHAAEAIIIADPDHRIRYVNPAFTRLSGFTGEEVIGKTPRVLRSGEHDKAFYANLHETITSGREWRGRTVNRAKDGTLYTEETSIVPVKDAEGHTVNYVSTKRDISDFLRAEQERIATLEQFHQSQKMESIGRLAGGVAHDFNNLLMVINGCAEMALEGVRPDDPLHTDLREILDAGKRAANLTRQLLAFSRKQALAPERLDLNQLITNLDKMLRRLVGEHITFELDLAPNIGRILGDPGQLEQVVMNLVVNARDAMPDGGTIRLATSMSPDDPGIVRLTVQDTGCGMTKEVLSQACEPFFTTKAKGEGTGLGLSTVLGIVKQSGGELHVESEPGKGTTFQIEFPQSTQVTPAKSTTAIDVMPHGERERILVVEDEESLRRMVERRLTSMGYVVDVAANGGEAILLIEEQGIVPDLIITDLVMPYMSGAHLADRLAQHRPDLTFLFMSGYTDEQSIPTHVATDAMSFLQKPFTAEELSRKVRHALAREAGNQADALTRSADAQAASVA